MDSKDLNHNKTTNDNAPCNVNGEKQVIILRGLPGSGKSTFAKLLTKTSQSAIIHSTDDYFFQNGTYKFDGTKIVEYHQNNYNAYCRSIENGIQLIVVDNTNFMRVHYQNYINFAKENGYQVTECIVGNLDRYSIETYAKRCIHQVPIDNIRSMAKRFEI